MYVNTENKNRTKKRMKKIINKQHNFVTYKTKYIGVEYRTSYRLQLN